MILIAEQIMYKHGGLAGLNYLIWKLLKNNNK